MNGRRTSCTLGAALLLAAWVSPATFAQSDCPGDDLARTIACLEQRLANPGRGTRMERRWIERGLARRILERDSTNVLALEVAVKWELDELFWQAQNASRFRTRYFERKREAAVGQLRAYLEAWQAAVPTDPSPLRQAARLEVLLQDWQALETTGAILVERFPELADGNLLLGVAATAMGDETVGDAAFGRALRRMDPAERALWLDPARFVPGFDVRSVPDAAADDPARPGTDDRTADAFWAVRDPRLLTPENERRAAHLARMTMADLLFGSEGGSRGWMTLEGDLVVRYGLPGNPLVAVAPYGPLPDVTGADAMEGTRKTWYFEDLGQPLVLWDRFRNGTFEFYSPPASAYSLPPDAVSMGTPPPDYELVARSLFRDRPEAYVHRTPGREVSFPHVIAQFRGEGGRTRVVTAFGIPVEGNPPTTGTIPISLDAGFFLVSARGPTASRRRPLAGLPSDGLMRTGPDTLWTGVLEVMSQPGRFATSMEFETTDGSAVGFARDSLAVRGFEDGDLAMSDLLFARRVLPAEAPATATSVTIGDLAVHPVPWRVFSKADPMLLVFQVYDVEVGPDGTARYGIEAVLDRADRPSLLGRIGRLVTGADPTAVSVSFDASAPGPDDTNSFALDTANVEPGTWRVTVRITDRANGKTVTSEAIVELIEPASR